MTIIDIRNRSSETENTVGPTIMRYGTDAQKTQAFGNDDGIWDVTFDNGPYGWAMPQAYLEFAAGDWSVKVGHFFTLVGYEVVPAVGNFFYSHAYTMFNSEPFTHTGALATYTGYENLTLYGGWTLGWDTGFDQYGGGSSFLGGFSQIILIVFLAWLLIDLRDPLWNRAYRRMRLGVRWRPIRSFRSWAPCSQTRRSQRSCTGGGSGICRSRVSVSGWTASTWTPVSARMR